MLGLLLTSRSRHRSVLEDPQEALFGTGTIPSRRIAAARGGSMYPPRFDYLAPRSVEEALDVLAERGDDAKVLAGGQSLIPLLKLRFAAPEVLVDINRLPGLDTLSEENGWLRIGPLVRHRDAERSTLLREHYPTMAAAAPQISDPLVRNLGTVCGSLAHADPSGDWGAVMIAMGAELLARSARGERAIPVRELFTGPFTTTLEPDELVTGVRLPSRQRTGGSYLKLERNVGASGTHVGCDTSGCGACTVLLDGVPIKSCTYLAVQADGRDVETVEGLLNGTALDPIQEAFKQEHGLQCGFCTPGMMLTAKALLASNPKPSDEEVRWGLSGNVCRCTGYMNIVRAVQAAAAAQSGSQT